MEPGDSCPTVLFRAVPVQLRFALEEKRALKSFACALSDRVADRRAFTCLITSDHELRRLNRDFAGHDYATDVLSFLSNAGDELGEMAISAERAGAQAAEFGHSTIDEIRLLMLHGVLHLIGFDHERDRGQMASAEHRWRGEFHLPHTLIARTRGGEKRL